MTSIMYPCLKVGFIDVPLAGGGYVNRIFSDTFSGKYANFDFEEKAVRFGVHAGLSEFEKHLGPALLEYFTFAFVRNTFDWLYARFTYSAQRPGHPDHMRCSQISFEDYVLAEGVSIPVRLQHPLVQGAEQRVTLIAEVREFGPILSDILYELGVDDRLPISTPEDLLLLYRINYTDRMVDHVRDVYAEDIDAFTFTFES